MGSGFSDEPEPLGLQQQRAQFLLLQQLQEVRAAHTGHARTVEPPGLRMAKVLKNPVHLLGKTLELVPGDEQGAAAKLRFSLDATAPGSVIVRRDAVMGISKEGTMEVSSSSWMSPLVTFDAGLSQTHTVEWPAETEEAPSDGITLVRTTVDCPWPLLVELAVNETNKNQDVCSQYMITKELTMCRILEGNKTDDSIIEVVQQQVCGGPCPNFELREIFGSEVGPDGASRMDCIVCQSEQCDTVVLPCRHMCLCSGCSEYIRTRVQNRSYRCPICRKRISRMMRIERQATAQSAPEEEVVTSEP